MLKVFHRLPTLPAKEQKAPKELLSKPPLNVPTKPKRPFATFYQKLKLLKILQLPKLFLLHSLRKAN